MRLPTSSAWLVTLAAPLAFVHCTPEASRPVAPRPAFPPAAAADAGAAVSSASASASARWVLPEVGGGPASDAGALVGGGGGGGDALSDEELRRREAARHPRLWLEYASGYPGHGGAGWSKTLRIFADRQVRFLERRWMGARDRGDPLAELAHGPGETFCGGTLDAAAVARAKAVLAALPRFKDGPTGPRADRVNDSLAVDGRPVSLTDPAPPPAVRRAWDTLVDQVRGGLVCDQRFDDDLNGTLFWEEPAP